MDIETLKSYLVNLGFAVNQPELRKFDAALKEAAHAVSSRTTGVIADVLKWQATLTGAFVGISGAIVGMADHVAMADQQYRLMGLRMFMTTENARKLSIGMKALGASLEEISWDPELNRNFLQLADLQDRLAQGLGPKFEDSMRGIRDMSQKFRELRIEIEYLSYGFVEKLFEKMGTSIGEVSDKLEKLIDWIANPKNFNGLTDWLADQFVPILKDTWEIVKAVGQAFGATAVLFSNLIGLMSGDQSIEGTTFSFHKLAGAIEHVVGWVSTMLITLTHAEEMLVHFADAAVLLLSGRFGDAKNELIAGLGLLTPGTGGTVLGIAGGGVGMGIGGTIGTSVGGAIGTAILPGFGTVLGGVLGGAIGTGVGGLAGGSFGGMVGSAAGEINQNPRGGSSDRNDIASNARQVALKAGAALGVDPKLIFEQLAFETGNFTNRGATQLHNLAGINVPGGHGQDYRTFSSFDEFGTYYADLLRKRYPGVAGANSAQQFAEALKHGTIGGWYGQNVAADTYARGMERFDRQWEAGGSDASGQTVNIGGVHIAITEPGASAEDIQAHVTKGMAAALAKQQRQTQRNQAQLAFVG